MVTNQNGSRFGPAPDRQSAIVVMAENGIRDRGVSKYVYFRAASNNIFGFQ